MGIVDYKPMDAVYIQPEPGKDSNPDVIAAMDFASQAQIDSGTVVDFNYFLNRMTRKITLTIDKIGEQSGIISCTALYNYAAHYSYTLTDDSTDPPTVTAYERDYTVSINNDFYSGNYNEGESGIYGLYFFFYPNTPVVTYPNVPGDRIDVVNRDNIDMSVYLIRQTSDAAVYNPSIVLREKYDPLTTPPHADMYYNRDQYSFRYYIGYPSDGGYSDYWYNTYTFTGNLIGTPAQNRLYGVSVELYKADSINADGSITGAPLMTVDASSLE